MGFVLIKGKVGYPKFPNCSSDGWKLSLADLVLGRHLQSAVQKQKMA